MRFNPGYLVFDEKKSTEVELQKRSKNAPKKLY